MSRKFLTPIVLPADPTAALEAATKQYVDARAGADEVFIGPSDPGVSYELWYDTDAESLNYGTYTFTATVTTVASGQNIAIYDKLFSTPGVGGLAVIFNLVYSTTAVSDLSLPDAVSVPVVNIGTGSYAAASIAGFIPASGGTTRVRVFVNAWGGQAVTIPASRSNGLVIAIPGTTLPVPT